MSVLKRVRTYLILNMPYSDHLVRVYKLHPTYRQKWQVIQRIAIEKSPGRCLTLWEEVSGPGMIGGSIRGSSLQE